MFKTLKLSQKITRLLLIIFLGVICLSGIALASILNHNAQEQLIAKALLLQETMNSVQSYTQEETRPNLVSTPGDFIPQIVPNYAARQVFETLRKNPKYETFIYKEATLNPTNLSDKADGFEAELIDKFRQNTNLKEFQGFRQKSDQNLFYLARPIAITDPQCLTCHSIPAKAPPGLVERYGNTHGFGWELNEIVATQMTYIPANSALNIARQSWIIIMGIITIIFGVITFCVNHWLREAVIRPLTKITQAAEAISVGQLNATFKHSAEDEVGMLTLAFGRMKTSLVMAIKRLEQYRNSSP